MAELMLINPRKRRRRHKAKARVHRRRRRHVARIRRRHSHMAFMSNPHKRRRRRHYARRSRGFLKGFGRGGGFINTQLMPAGVGAVGALGLDVLLGVLPLPAAVQTGWARPVVRIVGAVALGYLAGMVTSKKTGELVAAGAITVTLYDIVKGFVVTSFPTLPMGDVGMYPDMKGLGYSGAGMTVGNIPQDSMSEYVS